MSPPPRVRLVGPAFLCVMPFHASPDAPDADDAETPRDAGPTWFQGILLFGTAPGAPARQIGVMGVPAKEAREFHPCCFPAGDPPSFYDVTFADFVTGARWTVPGVGRRSGRGDYVELSTRLEDWTEHDHACDHAHGPGDHRHGPECGQPAGHSHGGGAGASVGVAEAKASSRGSAPAAKSPKSKDSRNGRSESDYRESVSFDSGSDSDSDAWTSASEEYEPKPPPRAPSSTSFSFETTEIKVGTDAERHVRKFFPKLQYDEDVLVLVGRAKLELGY
ncbi:hypothetical protein DFJ74DRAFT_702634 [Hyaloraphidium curvatum]|nr:hypothetical protein DFJ74DRAFT_702634 [Hyaloraphidium curvatum]